MLRHCDAGMHSAFPARRQGHPGAAAQLQSRRDLQDMRGDASGPLGQTSRSDNSQEKPATSVEVLVPTRCHLETSPLLRWPRPPPSEATVPSETQDRAASCDVGQKIILFGAFVLSGGVRSTVRRITTKPAQNLLTNCFLITGMTFVFKFRFVPKFRMRSDAFFAAPGGCPGERWREQCRCRPSKPK